MPPPYNAKIPLRVDARRQRSFRLSRCGGAATPCEAPRSSASTPAASLPFRTVRFSIPLAAILFFPCSVTPAMPGTRHQEMDGGAAVGRVSFASRAATQEGSAGNAGRPATSPSSSIPQAVRWSWIQIVESNSSCMVFYDLHVLHDFLLLFVFGWIFYIKLKGSIRISWRSISYRSKLLWCYSLRLLALHVMLLL